MSPLQVNLSISVKWPIFPLSVLVSEAISLAWLTFCSEMSHRETLRWFYEKPKDIMVPIVPAPTIPMRETLLMVFPGATILQNVNLIAEYSLRIKKGKKRREGGGFRRWNARKEKEKGGIPFKKKNTWMNCLHWFEAMRVCAVKRNDNPR